MTATNVVKLVREREVDREKIVEILEEFLDRAKNGEFIEVMVVGETDVDLHFASNGYTSIGNRIGLLEFFKQHLIDKART